MIDAKEQSFQFATYLTKVIAVIMALVAMIVSRYALVFFVVAMLPTICIIFLDRDNHRCLSATICSFNLIGVIPYIVNIWSHNMFDEFIKLLMIDIKTWLVMYGYTAIGFIIYMVLPKLVVILYRKKIELQLKELKKKRDKVAKQWSIDQNEK